MAQASAVVSLFAKFTALASCEANSFTAISACDCMSIRKSSGIVFNTHIIRTLISLLLAADENIVDIHFGIASISEARALSQSSLALATLVGSFD